MKFQHAWTGFLVGWLAAVVLTSCANWKTREEARLEQKLDAASIPASLAENPPAPHPPGRVLSAIEKIENLAINDVISAEEPNSHTMYDNSRYDFPITVNAKVEGWIDYFTGRGRRHYERYLARSSRYMPIMKHVLRKEGIPEDLIYLAMIESGFNVRARSWASAVGPWQFIKGTGTRYGLEVNSFVDERRDPIRSTVAAARYLKDLYLMFESWYLAAAAYNAGENKILRAIETLKTNNYWAISKTRSIRRETKDYVPKLIAAAIIAKNPERYGFEDVTYLDPLEFDIVQVEYSLRLKDVAEMINAPYSEILDLNPELYRGIVPPGTATYPLRVPRGSQALVGRVLVAKADELAKAIQPTTYKIRRGDTLSGIARQFSVRVSDITTLNNLSGRARIYPGRSLMIPLYAKKPRRNVSSKRAYASGRFVTHRVRRGESLWSISVKYNVTVQELFQWNKLKSSKIQAGKRLKVIPGKKEA